MGMETIQTETPFMFEIRDDNTNELLAASHTDSGVDNWFASRGKYHESVRTEKVDGVTLVYVMEQD
jgi:hypothetical protein